MQAADHNDYDVKLAIARERGIKAKELYNAALASEKTDPLQTVKLLLEAYLLGYTAAGNYLYKSEAPEKSIIEENIDYPSSPEESFYLGLQALSGIGTTRCNHRVLHLFESSARKNFAPAQNNLGYMYQHGLGVEQNYEKALKWFSLAAQQNNAPAQNNLGYMYQHGLGVKQNYEKALKWFGLAAEQNDARAQINLGYMYRQGLGVKQNYEKALKWYRLAAKQNNAYAQNELGYMYQHSLGVEQNYEEALICYSLAAEQNNAVAQINLGYMYRHSLGVEQNYKKALKWYRLAAEQNNAIAKTDLNMIYFNNEVPLQPYHAKDYRRDLQVLQIESARLYLERLADADVFSGYYHLAIIDANKKKLKALCNSAPDAFLEELKNDPFIDRKTYEEWITYLFENHVLKMNFEHQIEIAFYIFYLGSISHTAHLQLTTILRKVSNNDTYHEEAQWILFHLCCLTGNRYLAEYHYNHSLEASIPKMLVSAEFIPGTVWDNFDKLELDYCKVELQAPTAEFKRWLEEQLRNLEAHENNLAPKIAKLLYEFCFRLAEIDFDDFFKGEKEKRDALAYKLTHLWKKEPLTIPSHIRTLLKKIPEQHPRFESAQKILMKCEELAREPAKSLSGQNNLQF